MIAQIAASLDVLEALLVEQITHGRALIVAVFQQQPATRLQMRRRLGDDQTQVVQTVRARGQRTAGLEAHITLNQMRIAVGNVRRVAQDQIETLTFHGAEPVALQDAGVPGDDPAVQRALVFLERTQMNGATNSMPYAEGSTQGGLNARWLIKAMLPLSFAMLGLMGVLRALGTAIQLARGELSEDVT